MSVKQRFFKLLSVLAILAMMFSNLQPISASAQSGDGGGKRPISAQQSDDGVKRDFNPASGKVSFIGPESGHLLAANEALGMSLRPQDPAMALAKRFAPEFGVQNPERDLSVMKNKHGKDGRLTVKYQQKYQGIPVMGGELIVNTNDNGDLYSMNGEVSQDLSLSIQPGIDLKQAAQTALQSMGKWYQKNAEDFVTTEPELWIYDESLLQPSTRPTELVWRMEVRPKDAGMPVRELVLVDAQQGGISLHFNQIDTAWTGNKQADDAPTSTPEPPQPTETQLPTEPSDGGIVATPMNEFPQTNADAFTLEASNVEAANLGNTLYVATTGSDANDCATSLTPCATINGAIGKAGSGDTVYVAIGTYTGTSSEVVTISYNKNITLSGGWDETFSTHSGMSIIDGQGTRAGVNIFSSNTITIERIVVQNGKFIMGGGINNFGVLTLNNSTIKDNTSTSKGAGIANRGTVILNNSTIHGNNGIGIYNNGSQSILTVNNSTISSNTGNGINNENGTLTINNSTISGNRASGLYNTGISTLKNTIVADNSATSSGPDCYGSITSAGYNLIGNNKDCLFSASAGDLVGTDSNPIDPHLAPLQNYGGSTMSHALMTGSSAINAGNPATPGSGGNACLSTDQRGVVRPQEAGCDIGAFEYGGSGVTPVYIFADAGTPQYLTKGGAALTNLKAIVLDRNGGGVSGVTVTFTAPANGASAEFSDTGTNSSPAITDSGGDATSTAFLANNIGGSYVIQATVAGVSGSADFQITNMGQIRTYNANNTSALPGTLLCDQTKQPCTINNANLHADAAHTYAIGTYSFYATQFNRDSIDNNGMVITSTVHYCDYDLYYGHDVCPYDNASWNGSQMVYGDARGYPLADDVVAHELTHGVTQYESDLFYYYQSGAINESLSDVFGEYYDQTNGQGNDSENVKWLIGEDVSGSGVERSMSNPPQYGDPDKMTSPNYYTGGDDNGGIHWNSGVNNKAVYLMVDGTATDGPFNGKTVTALGWDKTAAIYYEANTDLLTSGADYTDLYHALQQACTNLVGQKGITIADCAQVKNALDAVEMNTRQKSLGDFDDPSFEYSYSTYPYWDQYSTNYGSPLSTVADYGNDGGTAGPHTGAVWGWFGGTTDYENASLSQTVYFPRGYPYLKLKFYFWIGRANAGSDANDKFIAQVDGVTVFSANATQKSSYSSYKQVSVNVSGFATNAPHTITFSSVTSGQIVKL